MPPTPPTHCQARGWSCRAEPERIPSKAAIPQGPRGDTGGPRQVSETRTQAGTRLRFGSPAVSLPTAPPSPRCTLGVLSPQPGWQPGHGRVPGTSPCAAQVLGQLYPHLYIQQGNRVTGRGRHRRYSPFSSSRGQPSTGTSPHLLLWGRGRSASPWCHPLPLSHPRRPSTHEPRQPRGAAGARCPGHGAQPAPSPTRDPQGKVLVVGRGTRGAGASPVRHLGAPQAGHGLLQVLPKVQHILHRPLPLGLGVCGGTRRWL